MLGPKQTTESLVIQGFLNGKSMDQIVSETNVSKGKVHYLINDWKNEIGLPYIDELREFSVTVRKSGISIRECAQGFRMINVLKALGIHEGNVNDGIDNKYEGNYKEFSSFIEEIYKNCKREGIEPSIIPVWIKNLLDFYNSCNNDKIESFFSINDDSGDGFDNDMDNSESSNARPKSIARRFDESIPNHPHQENSLSFSAQEEGDDVGGGDSNSSACAKENSTNAKPKQNQLFHSPNNEIKIPFVSQISVYIDQKKKEYSKIENDRKKIEVEVEDLKFQKALMEQVLDKLIKEKKGMVSYFQMFSELKKVLLDTYDIDIEEAIKGAAKIIRDFKENGYDVAKIIDEYKSSQSLKWWISENEKKVKELQEQRNSLLSEVSSLASQASMHKQTMTVYWELEKMGFGLPDLKQMLNTILEIAGTRKDSMSSQEAVSLFIRDIEENYHDKFLLEDKVKEKRKDLFQIRQELNNNRWALQLTPFVGTTLNYLFQNGLNENDIININQIVTEYANGQLQVDPQDGDNKGSPDMDSKAANVSNSDSNGNNRAEHWKSFIENLRKLGDINSSIKKQQETLEKIKMEAIELDKQKQDLVSQCQTAISFIGLMAKQIHHFNGLADHYYNAATKKIRTPSPTLYPLVINLICVNSDNQHKDGKAEDGKK
jgi:uncharacterized membrane-anchored protein YhcB (DUF1043 family)